MSSPIAKCSQAPLIHQVRAFSISKCSILLYLTLWDQHNMILRARKVVPSSTKPKSVYSHSLADSTGMDEAFFVASCGLCPSVGSYHPRDSLAEQVSPLESAGLRAWAQQELARAQQVGRSPGRGAGTRSPSASPVARQHPSRGGGRAGSFSFCSSSLSLNSVTKHQAGPRAG